MLQQFSFALGVAVIGSVFAVALGSHPGSSGYGRALDHALLWNIALLTVTFVAAFALPRRQVQHSRDRVGHAGPAWREGAGQAP